MAIQELIQYPKTEVESSKEQNLSLHILISGLFYPRHSPIYLFVLSSYILKHIQKILSSTFRRPTTKMSYTKLTHLPTRWPSTTRTITLTNCKLSENICLSAVFVKKFLSFSSKFSTIFLPLNLDHVGEVIIDVAAIQLRALKIVNSSVKLSKLPETIEELHMERIYLDIMIKDLKNLRKLFLYGEISFDEFPCDLESVQCYFVRQKLDFTECNVKDILICDSECSGVSICVRKLMATNCLLEADLSVLAMLKHLEIVNSRVPNVKAIENLQGLKFLRLDRLQDKIDLNLVNNINLRELQITGQNIVIKQLNQSLNIIQMIQNDFNFELENQLTHIELTECKVSQFLNLNKFNCLSIVKIESCEIYSLKLNILKINLYLRSNLIRSSKDHAKQHVLALGGSKLTFDKSNIIFSPAQHQKRTVWRGPYYQQNGYCI